MDTKRLFLAMGLSLAIVLVWQLAVSYIAKKQGWTLNAPPPPPATTEQVNAPPATGSAATAPTTGAVISSGNGATTQPGLHVIAAASTTAPAATQPTMTAIGSKQPRDASYVLGVDVSPQGAGLNQVVLNQFKQAVGSTELYNFQHPFSEDPMTRPLATRSATVNGAEINLTGAQWNLIKSSNDTVVYALDIGNESGPVVRLLRTFEVRTREATKGKSEGYEVGLRLGFENLSNRPVTVQTTINGTVAPPAEVQRGPDRNIISAYDEAGAATLAHHPVEEFTDKAPTRDLTRSEKTNLPLLWYGAGNTYFDAIIRPLSVQQGQQTPTWVQRVESARTPPPPGTDANTPDEHHVILTMQTAPQTVAPSESASLPMEVFFGPKQRTLLNNAYYSAPLLSYNSTLVMTSGMCGFCTFQWLIDILVWLLIAFHVILRDWGLAIIAMVCLVRVILHPITKRSQVNMLKMGKMGPAFEALKKKYGDDKEAMTKAQMQLYKEMGFTPVLGCLPMFLQMPIFIALWAALQSTFELRHAPFLWGFTWIKDLSQPDKLVPFAHSVPLFFFNVDAINLLPVLVAIVSFFNMKMTPQPPAQTPEQEQQRKMMQWMTLVFPLMFYKMPSGLNIYYLTTTSLGIIEGKIIRDHIKQREEAEKAGKVIVDASPTRRGKSTPTASRKPDGSENPGCLASVWTNLQKKVEEVQREADRRGKTR
jgi:YidC/Oxa1 family membrane protein insertase